MCIINCPPPSTRDYPFATSYIRINYMLYNERSTKGNSMYTLFENESQELQYRREAHRRARRSLWKTRAVLVGVVVGAVALSKSKDKQDNESK